MRLLTGAQAAAPGTATTGRSGHAVGAGDRGSARPLERLRGPERSRRSQARRRAARDAAAVSSAGVRWLWLLYELGLGGCLADDMGLGKTMQVIALLLVLEQASTAPRRGRACSSCRRRSSRTGARARALRAAPAGRWSRTIGASDGEADASAGGSTVDVVLTTYGTLLRTPGSAERDWGAGRARRGAGDQEPRREADARASRRCSARCAASRSPARRSRTALGDLWSIFDFVCPGLLGSAQGSSRGFVKQLERREPRLYAPLRELVRPYILRRLKTDSASSPTCRTRPRSAPTAR